MTWEEFHSVNIGQVVYFYKKINTNDLSTFSAAIFSRRVENNNAMYADNFIGTHYLTKNEALRQKIIEMRTIIMEMTVVTGHDFLFVNYKKPTTKQLKIKFNKIMAQKNVKPVIEKYPEVFI
jgi:hypothetical protein